MAGGTAQNPTPPCATLEITPDVVAAVNLAAIEFQRKYRLAGFSTFSTQSAISRNYNFLMYSSEAINLVHYDAGEWEPFTHLLFA